MTSPLLVDVSPWSPQRQSAWAQLAAVGPPWVGAILKASEGLCGYPQWFAAHWRAIGATALSRGCYHFLLVDGRGREQADAYLDAIDHAGGGWSERDLWPIVDVEEGSGNTARVQRLGKAIVEDTCSAFTARIRERAGRETVLYAGHWLGELGITSRMGCSLLWMARYTATLPASCYQRIGWDADSLLAWQYAGASGTGMLAQLAGYPHTTPIGDADISAVTLPGGIEAMRRRMAWAERPAASVCASGPER